MIDIRIYDNGGKSADRYMVYIDDHTLLMSDNANAPNGVCIYAGYQLGNIHKEDDREICLSQCPVGVLVAVVNFLREWYTEIAESI